VTEPSSTSIVEPHRDLTQRAKLLRKVHSLTGVVPVGAFMLVHLWINAKALSGQPAFDAAADDINRLPLLPLLELVILVPLLFHAGYGIRISFEGLPNLKNDPSTKNWLYVLQRVSGFVALGFIGFHLYKLRVPRLMGATNVQALYPTLCAELSSTTSGVPWVALLYLLGVAACSFHLANGMVSFASTWGITTTP
jgi:succinate dehydrogenase/fumarate reductase cytochrome b subunit (b558 family)